MYSGVYNTYTMALLCIWIDFGVTCPRVSWFQNPCTPQRRGVSIAYSQEVKTIMYNYIIQPCFWLRYISVHIEQTSFVVDANISATIGCRNFVTAYFDLQLQRPLNLIVHVCREVFTTVHDQVEFTHVQQHPATHI